MNYKDELTSLIEKTASMIAEMLVNAKLTTKQVPYLEVYVNEVLAEAIV